MGFGGHLVQGFRVYAWRAVPSFPQIALCFPSLALRPQPFCMDVFLKCFQFPSFLPSVRRKIHPFSSPPTSSLGAKNNFPSPNIFHSILLLYGLKVSSSTERKMYFECTKAYFSSVKMQICGHMSKLWLAYNWSWPVLAFPNISQGTLGRCRLPANGLCVS